MARRSSKLLPLLLFPPRFDEKDEFLRGARKKERKNRTTIQEKKPSLLPKFLFNQRFAFAKYFHYEGLRINKVDGPSWTPNRA